MKAMIDLEKDNLFDFFTNMGLGKEADSFIETYSKSEEEKEVLNAIVNKCLQIKQQQIINEKI